MAAKGGGNGGWGFLGGILVVVGLIYLKTGRGENDAPLIPNSLEGKIDLVVAALNQQFGHQWVGVALDALQAHIERTVPQVAALVNAVQAAEKAYRNIPNAGSAKKQYALQIARGLRA
jgi:hypothetical protein